MTDGRHGKQENSADDTQPQARKTPPGPYRHFQKFDASAYADVNAALKRHSLLTAREWVVARLCADLADASGRAPMSYIGEHLGELVPFMEGSYSRQDVAAAQAAFRRKVERCASTFFYAYYSGLLSLDEMVGVVHASVEHMHPLLALDGRQPPEDLSPQVQALLARFLQNVSRELEEK